MTSLQENYQKEIAPRLIEEMGYKNRLAAPRLVKIVVNVGLSEALGDKKVLEVMSGQLAQITGQKPKVTHAKKAIAAFKLRMGDAIGLAVTLRGRKMYDFLEKLVAIVLPRVRDFRGVSLSAFDGRGNYNLGIAEIMVFPEIDYSRLDKIRGLEITIVTTAGDDEKGKRLLELLGMPFQKTKVNPAAGGEKSVINRSKRR